MGSPESDLHDYLKDQEAADAYDEALEVMMDEIEGEFTGTISFTRKDKWAWTLTNAKGQSYNENDGLPSRSAADVQLMDCWEEAVKAEAKQRLEDQITTAQESRADNERDEHER